MTFNRHQSSRSWLRIAAVAVLLVALTGIASCTSKPATVTSAPTCSITPHAFCQSFQSFWKKLPQKEREKFSSAANLGTLNGRNHAELTVLNLYLSYDNVLTRYFKRHGINNSEIMADAFLQGFIKYVNGDQVDMNKLTKEVQESLSPPPPPPPPSASTPKAKKGEKGAKKGT